MTFGRQLNLLEMRDSIVSIRQGMDLCDIAKRFNMPASTYRDIFQRTFGTTAKSVRQGLPVSLVLKRAIDIETLGIVDNRKDILHHLFNIRKEGNTRLLFSDLMLTSTGECVKSDGERVQVAFFIEHLGPREKDYNLITVRLDSWSNSRQAVCDNLGSLTEVLGKKLTKRYVRRVKLNSSDEALLTATLALV